LTIGVRGSSIGASLEITMDIIISAAAGTKIQINARIETFGLLKTLPKSLIYKVVEDIETPILKCIKEKLE
jgi:carbon monoxide dehydrogenase subunit G